MVLEWLEETWRRLGIRRISFVWEIGGFNGEFNESGGFFKLNRLAYTKIDSKFL